MTTLASCASFCGHRAQRYSVPYAGAQAVCFRGRGRSVTLAPARPQLPDHGVLTFGNDMIITSDRVQGGSPECTGWASAVRLQHALAAQACSMYILSTCDPTWRGQMSNYAPLHAGAAGLSQAARQHRAPQCAAVKGAAKAPAKNETIIPGPNYTIPGTLTTIAFLSAVVHNYGLAAVTGILGVFLAVQANRVQFVFDKDSLVRLVADNALTCFGNAPPGCFDAVKLFLL